MKPTDYNHSPRHQGPRRPEEAVERKLAGYFLRDLLIAWLGGALAGLMLGEILIGPLAGWANRGMVPWLNPFGSFLWVVLFLGVGACLGAFAGSTECPPAAALAWAVPLALFALATWALGATASWAVFWRVMFASPWRALAPLAFTAPLLSALAYSAGAVLFPNARRRGPPPDPRGRRGRRRDEARVGSGVPFVPGI